MVEKKQPTKNTQPVKNAQPAGTKKDKKWIVALLLSILLGSIGVDRFYMGHVGLGILKLITAGGFGVWVLIDIILIATKHDFKGVNWVE
jgi:TM2 domain-containing membrane protein YozV